MRRLPPRQVRTITVDISAEGFEKRYDWLSIIHSNLHNRLRCPRFLVLSLYVVLPIHRVDASRTLTIENTPEIGQFNAIQLLREMLHRLKLPILHI